MRNRAWTWLLVASLAGVLAACGSDDTTGGKGGSGAAPGTGGSGGGGTGGIGGGGEGGSGGSGPDLIEIQAVMPGSGPTAGGQLLVIKGTGFYFTVDNRDDLRGTQVWFGENRSLDVQVIDDTTIYASSPAAVPGKVDVTVRNKNAEGTCTACFQYLPSVRIDSLEPGEGHLAGGTPFVLRGNGFDSEMTVTFGDRGAVALELQEDGSLHGIVPPADGEGAVDVRIFSDLGQAVARKSFTYVDTLRITEMEPPGGPLAGGNKVVLRGKGFGNQPKVFFGGKELPAQRGADGALEVTAPPAAKAGPVKVEVRSAGTSIEAAYGYFDPNRSEPALYSISPDRGSVEGGGTVWLVGSGFDPETLAVWFGEELVDELEVLSPNLAKVTAPEAIATGKVDVRMRVNAGSSTLAAAYHYFRTIEISQVQPDRGPVEGGTKIIVNGAHFPEGARLFIGALEAKSVTRRSEGRITAEAPAGSVGPAPVRVVDPNDEDATGVLAGGFTYEGPFRLALIEPSTGSRAGGTRVTARGTGFAPGMLLYFADMPGAFLEVVNPYTAVVTSPAGPAGTVSVTGELSQDVKSTITDAFAYYDPGTTNGGASGGPLNGTLNVTVLDGGDDSRGAVIAGCKVWVGNDASSLLEGVTDARGQVSFSSPTLVKAVNVHAECEGYESASVAMHRSENLTLLLEPNEGGDDDGDPPLEPPPGVISGVVRGFKKSPLRPLGPDEKEVAYVSYAYPHVFAYPPFSSGEPPPPRLEVDQEGARFAFGFRGPKLVTLYAIYGIRNTLTGVFEPQLMGMRRGVSVTWEQMIEDADIDLTIRLGGEVPVTIENPPRNIMGATEVNAFIDLGGDGVIPVATAFNSSNANKALLKSIPDLTGESFLFRALGQPTDGVLPLTMGFRRQSGDVKGGVTIGPLMGVTDLTVGPPSLEWTVDPGPQPEFFFLQLNEFTLAGFVPQWHMVVPGTERRVTIPPAAWAKMVAKFEGKSLFLSIIGAREPRFTYDSWTYTNVRSFLEYNSFTYTQYIVPIR